MTDSELNVVLYGERCAGTAACRTAAPTVFGRDSDGFAVVLEPHPAPALRDDVIDARDSCPLVAIEVLDYAGNDVE